ncbi:hypothetical protein U91I_01597 [alpha proteobacterium U9-1i]|nr:hypothetical protein U91I_01597 [alpha proteobacterium U9-1i]
MLVRSANRSPNSPKKPHEWNTVTGQHRGVEAGLMIAAKVVIGIEQAGASWLVVGAVRPRRS